MDLEMDLAKLLAELRRERECVEEAILILERLDRTRKKLRGRPPDGITEIKRRGRPPGSKNKPKADLRISNILGVSPLPVKQGNIRK